MIFFIRPFISSRSSSSVGVVVSRKCKKFLKRLPQKTLCLPCIKRKLRSQEFSPVSPVCTYLYLKWMEFPGDEVAWKSLHTFFLRVFVSQIMNVGDDKRSFFFFLFVYVWRGRSGPLRNLLRRRFSLFIFFLYKFLTWALLFIRGFIVFQLERKQNPRGNLSWSNFTFCGF